MADSINVQRTNAAPRAGEAHYRALVEHSADAVSLVAADGAVLYTSPATTRILGYTHDEFVGQNAFELIHPDDLPPSAALFAQLTQTPGATVASQFRFRHKDGSWRWLEATASNHLAEPEVNAIAVNFRDITGRKQAEQVLRDSEARYRLLFDSNPHPMWVYDLETLSFLTVNDAAIHHYGYSREEFLAMIIKDIRPPEDLPALLDNLAQPPQKLERSGHWRHRTKDGRLIDVEITSHEMRFDGRPARLVMANDITERRQAEAALRDSEDRYRDLVEHSQDLICTHDLQGFIRSANSAAARLLGYSLDELLRMNIRDVLAPEALSEFELYLRRMRKRGVVSGEMVVQTKAGERRVWEYDNSLRTEGVNEPIVRGMARDITERKLAEEALRESEERFRATFEQAAVGVANVSPDGRWLRVNQALCDIVGYSREELLQLTFQDITHPDDLETDLDHVRRILAGEMQTYALEKRYIHKDGSHVWIGLTVALMREPSGAPKYFISIIKDISEHRQAEEALSQHAFYLARLNDITQAAVGALDFQTLIQTLADRLGELIHADGCYLTMWDEARQLPVPTAASGELRENYYTARAADGELTMTASVLRAGHALVADDVFNSPYLSPRIAAQYPARSVLGLPLIADGQKLGAALIAFNQPHHFTPDEIARCEQAAGQIALAIAKARLLDDVQRELQERKQMEAALRLAEAKYRTLVNQVPAIIYAAALDRPYTETYISPQVERMLGFSADEWLAQPDFWMQRLHPDDRERVLAELDRTAHSGEFSPLEYRLLARDGRAVWIHDEGVVANDGFDQLQIVQGVMLDITERKLAEAALERSLSVLQATLESTGDGILVVGGNQIINFNQKFAAMWGIPSHILETRNSQQVMAYALPRLRNPEDFLAKVGILRADPAAIFQDTIELKDGRAVEVYSQPQAIGDTIIGRVLSFRDITERKQHEREREAILAVATALRVAQSRAEMLPIILEQLLALLGVDSAAVGMLDSGAGQVVIELGRGEWATATGLRLPPGEGIGGLVAATGRPYLTNDVRGEAPVVHPEFFKKTSAVACVPLIAQGQTIGVLWTGRGQAGGPAIFSDITQDDLRLLTAIGEIAANAIHRAALHEQTRQRLEQLKALRAIDTAISSGSDLPGTLDIVLRQVVAQLGVDAATVLLLDPQTQMLKYAAGQGFSSKIIEETRLHLGEGHAGRAALERRIVAIPNLAEAQSDPLLTPLLQAEGFISYYGVSLVAKGQVKGVFEVFHRAPLKPDPEWLNYLETLAGQAAIAIDNVELFEGLQDSNRELALAYDATIEGWSRALDLRDKETEGHSRRVTEMTMRLAQAVSMSEAELEHVRRGALLHDIGKMGIPDAILLKPDKLTDEEWGVMRKHPQYAYDMLSPITYLRPALDIPRYHHEKWDGSGYPFRLSGQQIPVAARLFAVVDVWDALLADRPYRQGWPKEKVLEHIREQSGKHFDPQVVELFLMLVTNE
ncbi:MAG: PAS domain S-box protein [Chloroflexi bacterium]|nr:PAS domain S-box protein [Chloroflexota bacterium]